MAKRYHAPTGKHCSNYRAETEALMKVFALVESSKEAATITAVVFLTDAWSVLEARTNNKSPEIAQALNRLSTTYNAAIQ